MFFTRYLATSLFVLTAMVLSACQPVVDTRSVEGEAVVEEAAGDLVASVVGAPIVPDGAVAGAPTDIVIYFNTSLDPGVPGRSLLEGKQIKITLPNEFVNTGLPVETVFTPDCAPPLGTMQCSTGILLQGWPQHPIFPMFPPGSGDPEFYTVSQEGTHTLVYTALKDVTAGMMLPGPGIKQAHLMAIGFVNPAAGTYEIDVVAETGPDGAVETGVGQVEILPETRPTISVTSVFTDGNPNRIYQKTSVGELTPLPYEFLLWGSNGGPLEGVSIEMQDASSAVFKKGDNVLGEISIAAPDGATGQEITTAAPSAAMDAPVSGVPTARLTAQFRAGSAPGDYELTFALNDGNSVTMFVAVE